MTLNNVLYSYIVALGCWAGASELPCNTDDQVSADVDYGTFRDPSSLLRPRFRYWIPDASVDLSEVARDFEAVAEKGAGGMELLGYYLYGNYPEEVAEGGPTPTDWTTYGWGTEAWRQLTDVALRATRDNGLVMDFALGPNQGAGVPAEPDDEGIMWSLVPFNTSVPVGGTFDDILPGWGTGEFVSASTGLVVDSQPANYSASPAFLGPYYYEGTENTLRASSLDDVTHRVASDGSILLEFPADSEGLEYRLFAYYQVHSEYRQQASPEEVQAGVPQSPVLNYTQNGSWVADHLSARGANLITEYWENNLLSEETRSLFREVGNYGWEDSAEFGAGTLCWWTSRLLEEFMTNRGYEFNKYIPFIYSYNSGRNGPLSSPDHFRTDEVDAGLRYINDYWQTLTELNAVYLETLTNWTRDSLSSQFSTQVVYNLPMDMLANVPSVNAPECESLGFSHVIDAYRQFAGPANLAGKRVISNELGAQRGRVYSQTMPELIWDVKRSIVGSVNNMVYHAYAFSGHYPNTTWPGYTTFAYRFSNMHGPRQPTWEHYRDYMDWTARTQFVAQSGYAKIDLCFWLKRNEYFDVFSMYEPNDLVEAGFTYEYLSPDNLLLPEAYVDDATLAPNRQAFKALILRQNDTLTVPGVEKLVDFAQAGLPIVFSGGLPQNLTGYNVAGTEYVRSALSSLLDLDNVHVVPFENLAASLANLGLTPRTQVAADRTWYTHWREDAESSTTYVYVYNDGWNSELGEGSSTGSVAFATVGKPYIYDAWTGDVMPVLAYQQSSSSTSMPMTLAGNQSAIIAFRHNETTPENHFISLPQGVSGEQPDPSSNTLILKAINTTTPALLANGTSLVLPTPATHPINLTHWTLTVESWNPPDDLYASQTQPLLSNTTYNLTTGLQPWNVLSPALATVSGRGIYYTTFQWTPPSNDSESAYLSLGPLTNTARLWLNNHPLPPLDPTNAVADLGPHLTAGENSLCVVVATTLGNVLRGVVDEVRSSGTEWDGPLPPEQAYGLVGDAVVMPYRRFEVAL
ncbi:hypothetical protein MBLNU230_g2006t1 [Neophaeotheca triangularis]